MGNIMSADQIYYNGKIITVDKSFSIQEALAITGNMISAVGSNADIMTLSGKTTQIINLKGKTVIPGLNDSHLHPTMAAVSELEEEIPDIHSFNDLFKWIKLEVSRKKPGEWIVHPKFFVTRIKERKYPTIQELDKAAPNNPVFLDGSYSGMVNSCALKNSGISEAVSVPGILKDPVTNKFTGFIRREAFKHLNFKYKVISDQEKMLNALDAMLKRYNQIGITSVTDGWVKPSDRENYLKLKQNNRLSVRVNMCYLPDFSDQVDKAEDIINTLEGPTGLGNEYVRVGPIKIILDGGILTGTARIKKPWGEKCIKVYGFDGKNSYGHLNYTYEQVEAIAVAAVKHGWKFTAHCTGDGAMDILLNAFEAADKTKSIRNLRWSVIHGNFFDSATIERCRKLGVVIECQPAWFYKDAPVIEYILGKTYANRFLPIKSMLKAGLKIAGGSDHMVKYDPNTSINPYNPFISIYSLVTRKTESGKIINGKEAISREDALKIYTINGAFSTNEEKLKGSIEPGKLADIVVLSEDILSCPVEKIKDIRPELTIFDGKVVYSRPSSKL